MLNDLSHRIRWLALGQAFPTGVMLGGAVLLLGADMDGSPRAGRLLALNLVCLVLAAVLLLAGTAATVVWTRRTQRRLDTELRGASADLLEGRVVGTPAPARVVRSRVTVGMPGHLLGHRVAEVAAVTVLTVLADDGPRRAAATVPPGWLPGRGTPAGVLLHPTLREVCLVDGCLDGPAYAAIEADPRWRTERLPTDRSVAGGWWRWTAWSVVGLLTGAAVPLGVGSLL